MTTKMIFQVSKVGSPIRKSPDQSLFATPRGLSQRITSFIACACQGIHRTPLRHLIVLIANTHLESEWAWQKDQLLETCPEVAVRQTCHVQRLSGLTAVNRSRTEPGYIFSSQFHTEQAVRRTALQTCFFLANDQSKDWWSRTGSNRRHPACKAGALPAELRPQTVGTGGPGRT